MNIVVWLVVGLIAGWLAGQVMQGGGYGLIGNIIVGIVGALVGGFLSVVLFGADYITGLNLTTIIVAFVGSVIFITILRALPGPSRL